MFQNMKLFKVSEMTQDQRAYQLLGVILDIAPNSSAQSQMADEYNDAPNKFKWAANTLMDIDMGNAPWQFPTKSPF